MMFVNLKTAVAGSFLCAGLLAGTILISEKPDYIVYFIQPTMERQDPVGNSDILLSAAIDLASTITAVASAASLI